MSEWGGKYKGTSSGSGGTYEFGQFAPTNPFHGNPGSSLRLYNDAFWVMTASSPGVVSPDNYDLYVDISPWILYPRDRSCGQSCPPDDLGNWYGIIFNARSSTFGSNPSQFHYNDKYYRLYFYNIDAAKPIALKLDRCDGDGNNPCVNLSTKSVPASFIGSAGGWDHIHITRDGTLIRVSINGTVVISKNDGTFTGGGKYGVFIFPSDGNDVTYPPSGYEMQVDFDNIKLYGR